jgi:hypothetical protein
MQRYKSISDRSDVLQRRANPMHYFTVIARGKNGTLRCLSGTGESIVICASDLQGKAIGVGDTFTYVNGALAVVREDCKRRVKPGTSKKARAKADVQGNSKGMATSAKSSAAGSGIADTRDRLTVISKSETGVLRCENASGIRIEIRSHEVGTQEVRVGDVIRYSNNEVTLVSRQRAHEVARTPSERPAEKQNATISRKMSKASLTAAARKAVEKQERRRRYNPVCSVPLVKHDMSDIQKLWEL